MRGMGFGLRDVEEVEAWGRAVGLELVRREVMPANNFLLVLEKRAAA